MKTRSQWIENLFNPLPRRRTHVVRTGAVLLTVIGLAVYASVSHNIPLVRIDGGHVVRAEFKSANFVYAGTPVRVGGVDVGRVDKTHLDPARRVAIVEMRLNDNAPTIKRDALAHLRWRTMLGGTFYVDLQPGSPSAPPLGVGPIPTSQTGSQVEFDHITQIYAGHTAGAQRTVVRELRRALDAPTSVGTALATLSATVPTIEQGTAPVLGREPGDLRKLVAATSKTVAALGDDADRLSGLVTGAAGTFGTLARERRALGETVELSPSALDSTDATMRRLNTTLGHLDPVVTRLRPGARTLYAATRGARPTLVSAERLLRDARPLLRSLSPAFASLQRASADGAPLMRGLLPTLDRLRDELLPWLDRRDPGTGLRTSEAIGPTLGAIASAAGEFDSGGYMLHFPSQTDQRSVVTGLPTCGPLPTRQQTRCDSLAATLRAVFGGRRRP